ncbi:MAG: Fpg/Nei family DNA glycosylase [Planctomycetota bacterium]
MPEYPDVTLYIEALEKRIQGEKLESVRLRHPFLLRTVDPPLEDLVDRRVLGLRRLGKRIVFDFEGELFLVIHLMIAGRFQWCDAGAAIPGKLGLAALDFRGGSLLLTEAGSRKRGSMHVVAGPESLARFDPGGLEVVGSKRADFEAVLRSESHTLKRALTDPRLFSGIGNAYSDEILHRARLSPMKLTLRLADEESGRLHAAACGVLVEWTERLRSELGGLFPGKVTAFREGMAVHGRYRKPCPDCGSPVQRIRYASNECNYCARCQNEGRLLADRSLSLLLKKDWPRTLEELEERLAR